MGESGICPPLSDIPGPAGCGHVWINPESYEPGDDIPDRNPDGWRWIVANWPHEIWTAWRALATETTPVRASVADIEAADYAAFVAVADRQPDGWRWVADTWPHEKWAEWRAMAKETTPEHARPEDIAAAEYAAYAAVADRRDPDDLPPEAPTVLDPEESREIQRGVWRRARWAYLKAAVEYREARAALRLARNHLKRMQADPLTWGVEIRRQRFRVKRAKIVRAGKFYAWDWARDAYRRARERAALAGVLDAPKSQVS